MKLFFSTLALMLSFSLAAQTKKIKLTPTVIHPLEFSFNKITVIDTRLYTSVVGWVTKGMDNILAPAVFEQSTAQAIERFYKASTGHLWVKGKDELVINSL